VLLRAGLLEQGAGAESVVDAGAEDTSELSATGPVRRVRIAQAQATSRNFLNRFPSDL